MAGREKGKSFWSFLVWTALLFILLAPISLGVLWVSTSRESPFASFRARNILPPETRKVLENGELFVLYSLKPISVEYLKSTDENPIEVFHDFPVLGKVEIQSAVERATLLKALYAGISENDGMAANCFFPRHGIRATLNGETVDQVICFECAQIETHAPHGKNVLTSASPQLVFDKTLQDAGVPLAEKRH